MSAQAEPAPAAVRVCFLSLSYRCSQHMKLESMVGKERVLWPVTDCRFSSFSPLVAARLFLHSLRSPFSFFVLF